MEPTALHRSDLPPHAAFIPTYMSNIACEHTDIWRLREEEVPANGVETMFRELSVCGVISISFVGGEPLTRPDIGKLVSLCRAYGIRAALTTNGLIAAERISELTDLGTLVVDLAWSDAHPYDKHVYEKALGSLTSAMDLGIKACAKVLLTRANISALPAILSDVLSIGVEVRFERLRVHGLSRDNSRVASMTPDDQELGLALRLIERHIGKGAPFACDTEGGGGCVECGHAQAGSFVITPSGGVAPCVCHLGSGDCPNGLRLGFRVALDEARRRPANKGAFMAPRQ